MKLVLQFALCELGILLSHSTRGLTPGPKRGSFCFNILCCFATHNIVISRGREREQRDIDSYGEFELTYWKNRRGGNTCTFRELGHLGRRKVSESSNSKKFSASIKGNNRTVDWGRKNFAVLWNTVRTIRKLIRDGYEKGPISFVKDFLYT